MEDIKDFWNKYWHKPKKVMANEFGHNETNKELALKFAKAYADHKLKLLGIADVVGQSEQLVCPHCGSDDIYGNVYDDKEYGCFDCNKLWKN